MHNLKFQLKIKKYLNTFIFILVFLTFNFLFLPSASARVTPEEITNAKKELFYQKVKSYSQESKLRLEGVLKGIDKINKRRTDQMRAIMLTQGRILDEYERRSQGKDPAGVKKARYWITYAHEAVAYQAAKVYVYDLTDEKNIGSDINKQVNLFKSDLNSSRDKVIFSQNVLKGVIK